jgi:hypothetical protein
MVDPCLNREAMKNLMSTLQGSFYDRTMGFAYSLINMARYLLLKQYAGFYF